MASPVVEKLGQIITKQTAASPDHARALLMAAYSWVNLAGGFRGLAMCVQLPNA